MRYLLDTDHISFLQRRAGPEYAALSARMSLHAPADFVFSVVSFHEQVIGAHTFISRAQAASDVVRGYSLLADIRKSFAPVRMLPFDAAAATAFDGLRASKVRVATMDFRLAATALSRGLILLTRNTRDFTRVPGLATEDWTT